MRPQYRFGISSNWPLPPITTPEDAFNYWLERNIGNSRLKKQIRASLKASLTIGLRGPWQPFSFTFGRGISHLIN